MRIAIIGCGVAGQAAAIALAAPGRRITVFERFETARPIGAGLLLQPSGLAVLERLGLRDAALGAGARVTRLHGRTPRGRTVMDLRYEDFRPGSFGLGIHRAALFELLHGAMLKTGVELKLGFDVAAIDDPANPSLVASDGRREGPFDLVLVAAGAHDKLRAHVSLKGRDPLYPWGAYWTICADREARFQGELRQVYDGAHTMMGVLPVGRVPGDDTAVPHVAFFWSLKHAGHVAVKERGWPALRKRATALWPEIEPLLEQIANFDALSLATYRDVRPGAWYNGRVLLIGDAAHGTSPQLGQGANLALCDALTLANILKTETDVGRAYDLYVRARCAHVGYYQLASRMLTPVFQSDSRVIGFFRDTTFPFFARLPLTRGIMGSTLAGVRKLPFGTWKLD